MKVLLIDPPFYSFMGMQSRYFPIGLGYLAACLRDRGHDVRIYSADASKQIQALDYSKMHDRYKIFIRHVNDPANSIWHDVAAVLKSFKPDVVGITAMTPKIASVLRTATVCKEYDGRLPVVIGGPHATIKPDEILKYKDVDFVVRGEAERAIVVLVDLLAKNDAGSLPGVSGLSYRKNGRISHNDQRDYIEDLDSLPLPARELLVHSEYYCPEDLSIIMTSRGCPFACTYCYKGMFARRVRYRAIGSVMEEIKYVSRRYGAKQLAFKDDSFTVNKRRIVELCDNLIAEAIKVNWECTTRVDVVSEHLLEKMMAAGCNTVKVGIESGSPRVLKMIKKRIDHEKVRAAAEMFNKYGLFWSSYFMMGLPDETEEDILSTVRFMKEVNPDYASISVYEPYPGTEMFETGVELGLVKPQMNWPEYFDRPPDEYYLKDPRKRTNTISHERFEAICEAVLKEFDSHNKSLKRIAKRALARRKTYYYEPRSLVRDVRRAARWIMS